MAYNFLTSEEKATIEKLYREGVSMNEIGRRINRHAQTVHNYITRMGFRSSAEPNKTPVAESSIKDDIKEAVEEPSFLNVTVKRGQIYYITKDANSGIGMITQSGRPAIIVSNDRINTGANIVEVVFLTTKEKKDMPTHVTIRSTGVRSTAICEQVHTINKARISNYCGVCTEEEMAMIEVAMACSLGMDFQATPKTEVIEVVKDDPEIEMLKEQARLYQSAIAEKAMYKNMYENLLEKILQR